VTQPAPVILVVEDEAPMQRFLRAALRSSGFKLLEATSAEEALRLATGHNPEIVLLDLGLPDRDGLEVTREIRGWSRVPIIVLSARGREEDKVEALDAGADDYLTKPFGVNELVARIRVALRHTQQLGGPADAALIECGPLHIDQARREVRVDGVEVHLTPTEYRMLVLLAQHVGKVLTHRQILSEVWGPSLVEQRHYVRVHMAQLRRKIEADAARPRLLVTELGVGYRLRDGG
jgi:two-component system KDP operon response regulator KdpE